MAHPHPTSPPPPFTGLKRHMVVRSVDRADSDVISALGEAGARQIVLSKELGETVVDGEERPSWNWPGR